MLVLTRTVGEKILIGDGITVAAQSVRGKRVRISVTAPPTVPVDRAEVRARRASRSDRSRPQPAW